MSDDVSLKKALIISLLLHLLLLWVPMRAIIREKAEVAADELKEDIDRMSFIFVETPENAAESRVQQITPFISDKNLAASNPEAPQDLTAGMPYQEGRSEVAAMTPEPSPPARAPQGVTDGSDRQKKEQAEQQKKEQEQSSFDALKQLEALGRLAPPQTEQPPQLQPSAQPQQPQGEPSRPYAPSAPRFDNRQSRAPVGSDFKLSTYAWNWAPYLKELKRRIENNIYPPPAFYMGLIHGRTFLRFKIQQDGTMTDFELITYTGHESLKNTSVHSISASAPFLPLPSDFPEPYLEITVGFFYNEFIR
ncbi:MAG: energy transducer TonB [Candidatus Glassbacteria bacterium]